MLLVLFISSDAFTCHAYSLLVLGHFDDFVERCCLSEFCFSRKYYSK